MKDKDPTRLVNDSSGWDDHNSGDVHDVHDYPGPSMPPLEKARVAVLGEFGGLGLLVDGHIWQADKNWGYRCVQDASGAERSIRDARRRRCVR